MKKRQLPNIMNFFIYFKAKLQKTFEDILYALCAVIYFLSFEDIKVKCEVNDTRTFNVVGSSCQFGSYNIDPELND